MNRKLLRKLFPLIAVLLLVPWPVAYAYTFNTTAVDIREVAHIEAAEASATPTWTVFGNTVGGVTPGELFYIDASDNPADITLTLYITNSQELIKSYRYLILRVGKYVLNGDGEWQEVTTTGDEPIPDTYITLKNGLVSFTLFGCARYKITIDSGSYSTRSNIGGNGTAPQFYLTAEYLVKF